MTNVEFIKAEARLCTGRECTACPLDSKDRSCIRLKSENPEKYVEIIEKWAEEHPIKTNFHRFQEVFGICPMPYEGNIIGMDVSWWSEEYEEPRT